MAVHLFINFRRQIEHTEKNGKMAPIHQIFILQQVKVEKNSFHSFIEQQISFQTM